MNFYIFLISVGFVFGYGIRFIMQLRFNHKCITGINETLDIIKQTYTMKATCKNCGKKHKTEILKNTPTFLHKTECPYCGTNTNCDLYFKYEKYCA